MTGKVAILTPLIKQLTETTLSAKLASHLTKHLDANHKNGSSKKTIKSSIVSFELATPCAPNSLFEP